ncbi:MAG: secretin and TonB N-terminal domain-containing protein [Bacteroides cellulosilyticus]
MQIKRARERIVMSLCIIFLLFAPISATAQSNSMKVSLNLKSASVKEFFDAVKAQTGLNFIYNTEQVKSMSRITIQSKGQPITEVLDKVLANTGYTYEIEGNIVTIVYQQPKEMKKTFTGVVVDEGGEPLPGVTVLIIGKEKNIGTMTDAEGAFSLGLPNKDVIIAYLFRRDATDRNQYCKVEFGQDTYISVETGLKAIGRSGGDRLCENQQEQFYRYVCNGICRPTDVCFKDKCIRSFTGF